MMAQCVRLTFFDKYGILSTNRERTAFMGIASLVLGISSILCAVCSFVWPALVLGAVGIVLGVLARKNQEGGMATAGFVLSIIGASLAVLTLVTYLALVAWLDRLFGMIF